MAWSAGDWSSIPRGSMWRRVAATSVLNGRRRENDALVCSISNNPGRDLVFGSAGLRYEKEIWDKLSISSTNYNFP